MKLGSINSLKNPLINNENKKESLKRPPTGTWARSLPVYDVLDDSATSYVKKNYRFYVVVVVDVFFYRKKSTGIFY